MKISKILVSLLVFALYACGGGGGSDSPTVKPEVLNATAPVAVNVKANYVSKSKMADKSVISVYSPICKPGATTDSAGYVSGLDCDGDGAPLKYIDPSSFSVAIKRLAFRKTDGSLVDLIADKGKLSDSEVLDLTNAVKLDISEIPTGNYNGIYAEFYYYDLTMDMYNPSEKLRLYLSDDDFPAEGNLGHHQGDVMLYTTAPSPAGVAANSYGFVLPGEAWTSAKLVVNRDDMNNDGTEDDHITGASTADAETGHDRGLYGNDELWNSDKFKQGPNQDIFIFDEKSPSTMSVGNIGGTFTITFDITKTWFYEDFDNNDKFEPCMSVPANREACSNGAEWSPIFPGINVSFQ